ncbi:MAG: metalloregulator ArsR/SmtB family transcription factor [Phycisphaeraceae bacterium]
MRDLLTITKALADETRLRALMALRDGELCLCQLIDVLGLSPSTVSQHLGMLYDAGLVERRKEGRWHYYRLIGREGGLIERQALRWVVGALKDEHVVKGDAKQVCCAKKKGLGELAECYRS